MDMALLLAAQGPPNQDWRTKIRRNLEDFSDVECKRKFRLPRENLQAVIDELSADLTAPSSRNNPISPTTQVLASLRLLASGSFQSVTGDTVEISQPSMSRVLVKFCTAFSQHYGHLITWYRTPEEASLAKRKFYQSSGFKGLLGLIDGTMIPIKGVPGNDEPAYICRKNFPAINVQVVVGPDGDFRDAVIRYPGSCHDSFIFNNSSIKVTLEQDPSQGYLFGDSGYASSAVMVTPYTDPTTRQERHFNQVHSQVRSKVERCIGRLKSRWRCLHSSGGALQYEPAKCCLVIHTCMLLENMCISLGLEDPEDEDDEEDDDEEYNRLVVRALEAQNANQTRLGQILRNGLAEYIYANRANH